MVPITLIENEMLYAAEIGVRRQLNALRNNRIPYYGSGVANDWQLHIEGAMGEMCVAKYLGIPWTGGEFGGPDVGDNEVRTTSYTNGHLILHPADADDRYFWLVTGVNGHYNIAGRILGRKGKNNKYWKNLSEGRPAFCIPQRDLEPPECPEILTYKADLRASRQRML